MSQVVSGGDSAVSPETNIICGGSESLATNLTPGHNPAFCSYVFEIISSSGLKNDIPGA
jgi:hypothetical protein